MLNSSTESTSTVIGGNYDGLNRDAGDGISNLNPDDIESINILKGSSAAALYGSQAANGVILIHQLKGKGRTAARYILLQPDRKSRHQYPRIPKYIRPERRWRYGKLGYKRQCNGL